MTNSHFKTFLFVGFVWFNAIGCHTITPNKSALPKNNLAKSALSSTVKYQEILATDLSYDNQTGIIQYTLPRDAWVRIRIGLRNGGALLNTLLDWEPREAGTHLEKWDKKDPSGQIYFGENPDILLVVACVVPVNDQDTYAETNIRGFRKSPHPNIKFLESKKTENGLPVISGIEPVRIELNPEDKKWLTSTKYEVAFFLDQTFVFEDEEGNSPYTYLLNTEGINDGEHVITTNIIGYDGEIGTKSERVWIKNADAKK